MSDPEGKRLRHYSNSRIRNAKLSYKGTRNVAIYSFSLGKFLNVRVYACVKDLTNIMSAVSGNPLFLVLRHFKNFVIPGIFPFCNYRRHVFQEIYTWNI